MAENSSEEIINQIITNGTEEITIDSVTYYKTKKVVNDEPEESIIERLKFTSQAGDMINAYVVIESGKKFIVLLVTNGMNSV